MTKHKVVSQEEWLAARKDLLKKEKELSHRQEEVARDRRALPWVKVSENYVFQYDDGDVTLSDLFEDRSQLIVYHFMLHESWEEGCLGCSYMMDNLPARMEHLDQKDVKFVVVSRTSLPKIEAFKRRMEWNFKWVSSLNSKFNFDYQVSFTQEDLDSGRIYHNYEYTNEHVYPERPGISVFFKDDDANIYHTYSTYGRGLDAVLSTYHYLDMTPKGRDEEKGMNWVKLRYKYEPR